MTDFQKGDQVIIKDPFWHNGTNLGGKLGIVVDTKGYILVRLQKYNHNPVKCFQYDIEKLENKDGDPVLDDLQLIWEDDYSLFRL